MRNSDRYAPGIHLCQGNRLESLVRLLAERLRMASDDPLASQTILVPHPAMAQWLKMSLADALGIAANLVFPLPAVWLGQRAASGIGQPDVLAWGRDALTWRLLDLQGAGFGPLSTVVDADDRHQLARWQLARQIAQTFEGYLLQRPDWLRSWCEGRSARTGIDAETWQMRVWQQLFTTASTSQQQALQQRLDPISVSATDLPPRLFAFGFASLPQLLLEDLQSLATRIPVHLFFPNPCRWYWGDLLTEREQLTRSRRLQYKPGLDVAAEGHPLLANLGAVGRDFLHVLYERIEPASETEVFEAAGGSSVLAQLQDGLLDLDPGVLDWREDDRSLRFLVAPNPRRELDGLHDVLLDMLADPSLDLRPHEIAVMVPKLSDYAPIIDAVFGAQPEVRRIPWQVTDLAETDRHPLAALFLKLIDLPVWRFSLSEVLDALARPAFAAAFDIAADELPRLAILLEEAGARWGLDGDVGARAQAGGDASFTFRFAIDRLISGWLLGEDVDFAEGVAPFSALRGADAELLGRFVACLETLDRWRRQLAQSRTLPEWAAALSNLCEDCFRESHDEEENAALLRLAAALERWRQRNVFPAPESARVARRVLRESIAESLQSTAVSALPGEGVNFCAMVPLRGLPFRVIVLLGLGEGDFPRQDRERPDDLCRWRSRPGDRTLSAEDRYLFLEALLSARDGLIMSRVDRDETGLPREPSPVLAEFIDDLRVRAFSDDADAFMRRVERMARLPTDLRHLHADGPDGFVPNHAGEWVVPSSFLPSRVSLPIDPVVHWSELRRFFIDPARTQLRWRGVDLTVDREQPAEDSEPFELDGLQAYQLRETLIPALADRPSGFAETLLFEKVSAQGRLPPGPAGREAFDRIRRDTLAILDRYASVASGRQPQRVEGRLPLAEIDGVVRIDDIDAFGVLRRVAGRIDGKRRMGAWLDLLALSLMHGEDGLTATLVGNEDTVVMLPSPASPRETLETLLHVWRRARLEPLPIYPKASAAYAESWRKHGDEEKARKAAQRAWQGDGSHDSIGECDDPDCAELARCFSRFDDEPFAILAKEVYGQLYGPSP